MAGSRRPDSSAVGLSAGDSREAQPVQDYTDLKVHRLAFESAMRIYELSKKWPREERYSLTDQIRRSSRSVCGNIAEAWRKRRYPAHFGSKLSDADAEAAETEVWLDFALRCGHLGSTDHAELREHYDHICRMLTKMIQSPGYWCTRTRSGSE
jgi:four helix bundle protein